jgi:hypothetical protein
MNSIKYYCTTPTKQLFSEIQDRYNLVDRRQDYIYIDNNSKILGVAHLDTVLDGYNRNISYDDFHCAYYPKTDQFVVQSISLDDRLGVFTLLETLPAHGLKFDILLTLDEEIGSTTAANFLTDKKYNWIFSFDRRGLNPVLYQFNEANWKAALVENGYKIDYGSFSDIGSLEGLGCCAVNCGVAYNFEHTKDCHVVWGEYQQCVEDFKRFYQINKGIHFPHTAVGRYGGYGYSEWYGGDYEGYDWRTRGGTAYATTATTGRVINTALAITPKIKSDIQQGRRCTNCGQWLYAQERKFLICEDCLRDDKL